jgi:hypothetical protein
MDEIVDEYIDDVIKRNPSFMKKITRLTEKQWLKEWGERCPEYEPECPCCVAWRKFDEQWG